MLSGLAAYPVLMFLPVRVASRYRSSPMLKIRRAVAVLLFAAFAVAAVPPDPGLAQPIDHPRQEAAGFGERGWDVHPPLQIVRRAGGRILEGSAIGGTKAREAGVVRDGFCEGREVRGADREGLRALYCAEAPVVTRPLLWAHRSSYPVFYTAVPVAWLGAAARGTDDFSDAYRLTLTQGATYLTVLSLKKLFHRPRPFMQVPGVTSRSSKYGRATPDGQFASLPSGHAGLSVALATSWSLSHPHWYVIAPSALWSGAVSLSRLHLGVHYPSDILFGAVLGAGIATGIHLLRDALTPPALKADDEPAHAIDPTAALVTGPMVVLFRATF